MNRKSYGNLSVATRDWLRGKGYNPENLNQTGENGDTALMKATREGLNAVVKELIDLGADINARNNDNNNALWFACFGNHYDLIHLLLAAKINIDNQNDNGATVLMYAASAGKTGEHPLLEDLPFLRKCRRKETCAIADYEPRETRTDQSLLRRTGNITVLGS